MSVNRLEKFLRRTENRRCNDEKIRTLLVVGDSKVKYIRSWARSDIERAIIWYSVGGLTTQKAGVWLNDNIDNIIKDYGYVDICLWTGTCDITRKVGKFIYPSSDKQIVDVTLERYTQISQLKLKYGIRLSFIIFEVPYFSVSLWNKHRGHRNPSEFSKSNRVVEKALVDLNLGIKEINLKIGTISPRFSIDLVKSRVTKTRKQKVSTYHNYNLLKDGVHPTNMLAQYWMRKVESVAIRESYI